MGLKKENDTSGEGWQASRAQDGAQPSSDQQQLRLQFLQSATLLRMMWAPLLPCGKALDCLKPMGVEFQYAFEKVPLAVRRKHEDTAGFSHSLLSREGGISGLRNSTQLNNP